MITMAIINRIKNEYFRNGKSISEIARVTGHDRKTVRKALRQKGFAVKEPSSKEDKPHCIDPFLPILRTWIEENSHQWHKNRLTATRMHDLLQERFPDTYHCSYRTLAYAVKEIRTNLQQQKEAYIPLVHPPGEAQGDFGTTYYYDAFHRSCEGSFFSLDYPYSNAGFTQLFRGETLECFLQGLLNIFQYTQSVPPRIWFDNASPLVKRILKEGKRIIADRFYRFANHYGFTPVFCNPHSAYEKGGVENKVGYHRRNLFTPYLEVTSLEKTNQELLRRCTHYNQKMHYLKKVCIQTLFQEDQNKSIPLNKEEFLVENVFLYKRIPMERFA
jgi:transposase